MNTSIVPGSLSQIAKTSGASIAETFLGVDAIILIDVSGSMADRDARGGLSRHEVAAQELATLQGRLPGKLAVIAFSFAPVFCPSGVPVRQNGTTDLEAALRFVKIADDPTMRFIVISDGEPNSESGALAVAATFRGAIDTVYVGPESGSGSDFLRRLAAANHGRAVVAAKAQELAAHTERLLLGR